MKDFIPKDKHGIFIDVHDTVRVDSNYVAEFFKKEHETLVCDIEKLISPSFGFSEKFITLNFERVTCRNIRNKKYRAYYMTRDAFVILAMSYGDDKITKIKDMYVKRFDEMESILKMLIEERKDFPLLTDTIKILHEEPRPYHFSGEYEMLYTVLLGKSTKRFRQENGIAKWESIRPYLNNEQIKMLERLQLADVGLLVAFPKYEDRMRYLDRYKTMILEGEV